jgi:hypothetical protein
MCIWEHAVRGTYVEVIVKYRERWMFCMEAVLDTRYAINTLLIVAKPKPGGRGRFAFERQDFPDQLLFYDNVQGELQL